MVAGTQHADTLGFVEAVFDPSLDSRRTVITDGSTTLSAGDLADRLTMTQPQFGVGRRLIAMHLDRSIPSVVAYLAALRGGHAVLVVPSSAAAADELFDVYRPDLTMSGASLVGDPERPSGHELHEDLALLLSTSGTTGSPNVVRLSRRNLDANAAAIASTLDLRAGDTAITSLPLTYCYGLSVLHSHLLVGGGIVLTEASVSDERFWDVARVGRVTTLAGVPHTFDLLDSCPHLDDDIHRLRLMTQAGGRLAPERVAAWAKRCRRHAVDFAVMYGQTEATARMAVLRPDEVEAHPDTVGRAIDGGRFEVVGSDARPGIVGPLRYHGDNVMMGYATSARDLATGSELGGVLDTGDLAEWTAAGMVRIVGRAQRIIKPFGLRIDLDELERLAERRGELVWTCGSDDDGVVAAGPSVSRSTVDWLADLTGLPTRLIGTVRVDVAPRLASGKIDYATIASLGAASRARPDHPEQNSAASVFATTLGVPEVAATDSFVSLHGDSLSYVETSLRLEQLLGVLPVDWHRLTVAELDQLRQPHSRWARLETGVALRAAAMVLIVSRHLDLLQLAGGAHALLALAGFNMARFQLDDDQPGATKRRLWSAGRIAIPTIAWLLILIAFGMPYGWSSLTLTHSLIAEPQWNPAWRYWFIEALVHLLLATAALMAIPKIATLERRWPFMFALAVGAVTLLGRPDSIVFGDPYRHLNSLTSIAWLFALGWIIARSTHVWQRALATVLVVALVPGFFGDGRRDAIVFAGLLLLTWVRSVPMPHLMARITSEIAGASLAIYLVHWQLYPVLLEHMAPGAVLVICLASGVAVWRSGVWCAATVHDWRRTRSSRPEEQPITTS